MCLFQSLVLNMSTKGAQKPDREESEMETSTAVEEKKKSDDKSQANGYSEGDSESGTDEEEAKSKKSSEITEKVREQRRKNKRRLRKENAAMMTKLEKVIDIPTVKQMRMETNASLASRTLGLYPITMADINHSKVIAALAVCKSFVVRFSPTEGSKTEGDGMLGHLLIVFKKTSDLEIMKKELDGMKEGITVYMLKEAGSTPQRKWVSVIKLAEALPSIDDLVETTLFIYQLPASMDESKLWELFPDALGITVVDKPARRAWVTYRERLSARKAYHSQKSYDIGGGKMLAIFPFEDCAKYMSDPEYKSKEKAKAERAGDTKALEKLGVSKSPTAVKQMKVAKVTRYPGSRVQTQKKRAVTALQERQRRIRTPAPYQRPIDNRPNANQLLGAMRGMLVRDYQEEYHTAEDYPAAHIPHHHDRPAPQLMQPRSAPPRPRPQSAGPVQPLFGSGSGATNRPMRPDRYDDTYFDEQEDWSYDQPPYGGLPHRNTSQGMGRREPGYGEGPGMGEVRRLVQAIGTVLDGSGQDEEYYGTQMLEGSRGLKRPSPYGGGYDDYGEEGEYIPPQQQRLYQMEQEQPQPKHGNLEAFLYALYL